MALEGFISISGTAGGVYMASHAVTVMPTTYLQGTWFHTWLWPGVALFFFVGVCPALVVAATLLRLRVAGIGHLCLGVGLVAWILLEAGWVVVAPGLQISVGAMGVIVLGLGRKEFRWPRGRETEHHSRSRLMNILGRPPVDDESSRPSKVSSLSMRRAHVWVDVP